VLLRSPYGKEYIVDEADEHSTSPHHGARLSGKSHKYDRFRIAHNIDSVEPSRKFLKSIRQTSENKKGVFQFLLDDV
jgi:hypothetical protein